jgi:UDP:flavonoid glycosyltransferase YjiC (YdhE family)
MYMRLTVVTFGSEGDTRPLVALCRGLLDRGHEPLLFADESTLSLARRLNVPALVLRGNVKSALPIGDPKQEIRIADVIKAANAVKAIITANSATWLRTVGEHARGSDVILFSSLAVGIGTVLSEELKKPSVALFFQPLTPTREFSSPMLPPLNLPGWANRTTFKLSIHQMWSTCGKPAEAARREVFGTRGTDRGNLFKHPILYGFSRELVPPPQDWPAHHYVCGHWSMPASNWQPAPDLREFLAAGEPPIYAGFGSPSGFIRVKALGALVDAVAGRRAVFGPGWSNIDANTLPKNFFIARDVPHEWLFPRMSTVIHHGGAGTTHTAARAGVPQIILPIAADQYFWADRVARRGVAPKYTRGARLNPQAIASMIEWAQRDEARTNARLLSDAMSREDGVGCAVRHIEEMLGAESPFIDDRVGVLSA